MSPTYSEVKSNETQSPFVVPEHLGYRGLFEAGIHVAELERPGRLDRHGARLPTG
jgi:hypothetical protein